MVRQWFPNWRSLKMHLKYIVKSWRANMSSYLVWLRDIQSQNQRKRFFSKMQILECLGQTLCYLYCIRMQKCTEIQFFFFNRWFKVDGVGLRQVLPSPKIKHHLEVLILQELLVEDSGIYVCIMNNTAGAERIEVNLTVRSSLDTLVTPSQQTIDLNQAAIFTCTVTGYPKQHVYWIKNGQTLQLDGHR